jgi:hypothetical protein
MPDTMVQRAHTCECLELDNKGLRLGHRPTYSETRQRLERLHDDPGPRRGPGTRQNAVKTQSNEWKDIYFTGALSYFKQPGPGPGSRIALVGRSQLAGIVPLTLTLIALSALVSVVHHACKQISAFSQKTQP